MSGNPLQYTSRTYNSALADINSDKELVDKPDWWKRMIAGLVDIFSMMLNAEANNNILRTSFTRQATADLLELIDYQLLEQQTSSGGVIFYVDSGSAFPFTVAQADLAALSQSTSTAGSKRFEARSSKTVTAVSEIVAAGSVSAVNDTFTVTREYTTGEKIIITGADVPLPLVTGTEYYVIKVNATTIKLSTTLADAYAGTEINLTDAGTGNHTLALYSFIVTMYQQETKASQVIGTSDGTTEFQEFNLPDLDVLRDTLIVTINSNTYTQVTNLVDSESTDEDYKIIFNTDLSSKLQFGNGTYGIIPPAFDIEVDYAVGGGVNSNLSTINGLTIYDGTDSNIEGLSNYEAMTGGAAEQSVELGKILGPLLLKARDRYVTSEDGQALALAFGTVSQVVTIKNAFGVLSSRVLGVALGGGNLSGAEKTALEDYLIDRTILESIDVRVEDITFLTQNVTSAAKMKTGYVYADEEPYFELAWNLFFTETGKEIYDTYISSGITDTVTLINSVFSTAFTTSDYDQVEQLVKGLNPNLIGYREIGVDVEESDAFAYIQGNVFSIDNMTITLPVFPISVAVDEITTPGALTLTEIP